MAAYLIADVEVHDPIQFASYREAVAPMIARFGGRYLMRGPALEVREGAAFLNRLVVLEVPTMEALRAFYDSPDYAPLIAMVDHMIAAGFVKATHRRLVVVTESAEAALDLLETYDPPLLDRWIERKDI
jgi:uncharacterized protein (DUF1330 family)